MDHCKALDPIAKKIGAVNTVDIRNGLWKGYNTDYLGFIRSIKENIPDYISYHPVIIGYGGGPWLRPEGFPGSGKLSFWVIGIYPGEKTGSWFPGTDGIHSAFYRP